MSIEVDPRLAADTAKTVEEAKALRASVDRPNVHIKIPATVEGLPAISQVLAEGISVNVTLIFSLDRYRGVMNAFLTGLEQARQAGKDLSKIHSVASFFVSRVDTEIDKRLDAIGTDEAKALKGKAGVANARLAYQAYEEVFSTPRWQVLEAEGAHKQRPLWASTGVKDPAYRDTMYVVDLVAPNTVNTMPSQDPRGRRRPRRHRRRPGDRQLRRRQARCSTRSSASASPTPTSSTCSSARASTSSRSPGASCSTDVQEELDQGRDRRLVRRGGQVTHVALGVVAAGPAADAIAPARADAGRRPVRQPAVRPGRHPVGSRGRVRVGDPAVLGRAPPVLAAAGRRGRGAARRTCASRGSTTSCSAGWAARRWRPRSSAPPPGWT